MKRWILTCLVAPLFFAACDPGKSDPAPAAAPSAACMNGTTYCDSSLYGFNRGFSAYPQNPYDNPNAGNFCSCPTGQRPVYNGQYGLGCISNSSFQAYAANAVYWTWAAGNNQWVNQPQISNTQGYFGNSSSCYKDVAQTCFVDQPNSCGTGLACIATAGASRVGICASSTLRPGSAQAAASTAAQPLR